MTIVLKDGASSLALLKGTLNLMALTKLKTAAVIAVIAVLVSGTTIALAGALPDPGKGTFSSFDSPAGPAGQPQFDAGGLKFADADLATVLALYEKVSKRTVIHAGGLPEAKFSLHNQAPLNRVESLRLLDTLLAENGVTMVLAGDAEVKAVPSAKAMNETAPFIQLPPGDLPDSSSYMSMTVPVQKMGLSTDRRTQTQIRQVLGREGHFQKNVTLDTNKNEFVLRDYSANIRRMLQLIEQFNPATVIARAANVPNPNVAKRTFSSFDAPAGPAGQKQFDVGRLKFDSADLSAVLGLYQEVSGRTVLRAGSLPQLKITFQNPAPLNRVETLRCLDTTLAQNRIFMVLAGNNAVIATQNPENEVAPIINSPEGQLPDSSSYMMTTVRLIKSDPDLTVKILGMKAKQPNSVMYMPAAQLLILRDFSSGIRQMLHVLPEAEPDVR